MLGRRRQREPEDDYSGHLHVLRESACPGPMELVVQVDGMDVTSLEAGDAKSVRLSPGSHSMHVRAWYWAMRSVGTAEWDFNVVAGEEIEVMLRCVRHFLIKDEIRIRQLAWRGKVLEDRHPVRAGRTPDWSQYQFEVFETRFNVEPAGERHFVEDNTYSDVSSTRVLRVENEWSRTVILGGESTVTRGVTLQIGVSWLNIQPKLESTITHLYSIEQGERHQVSEEVQVEVPARTRLEVVVSWRTVWREGLVRITGPGGAVDVPFKFVNSMEFDRYTTSA